MKKALFTFLFCLILALSCTLAAVFALHGDRDQVVVTSETLSGDPAAARGFTAHRALQYRNRLLWELDIPLDDPAGTVARFSTGQKLVPREPPRRELSLYTFSGTSYGFSSWTTGEGPTLEQAAESNVELSGAHYPLFEAVYETTPAGQTTTATLRAADYLDHYPLELNYINFIVTYQGQDTLISPLEEQQAAHRFFRDFFSFPIPEDMEYTVTVKKYPDGTLSELSCDSTPLEDPYTLSAYHGEHLYFTFLGGHGLDFSHTPGGFGLYHLKATPHPEGTGDPTVELESLTNALPLPAEAAVRTLSFSRDGRDLLLCYYLGENCFLDVLDPDTLELRQSIPIPAPAPSPATVHYTDEKGQEVSYETVEYPITEAWTGEDFLLLLDYTTLHLLTKEDGGYTYQYACPMVEEMPYYYNYLVCHWDGQRLAYMVSRYDYECSDYTGFYVAILEDGAVTYQGNYTTSLGSTLKNPDVSYGFGGVSGYNEWAGTITHD